VDPGELSARQLEILVAVVRRGGDSSDAIASAVSLDRDTAVEELFELFDRDLVFLDDASEDQTWLPTEAGLRAAGRVI